MEHEIDSFTHIGHDQGDSYAHCAACIQSRPCPAGVFCSRQQFDEFVNQAPPAAVKRYQGLLVILGPNNHFWFFVLGFQSDLFKKWREPLAAKSSHKRFFSFGRSALAGFNRFGQTHCPVSFRMGRVGPRSRRWHGHSFILILGAAAGKQ